MAYTLRVRLSGTLMMVLLMLAAALPLAAQAPSSIRIDNVDDSAFPQVDVTVTVSGAALAQGTLTVADFQLFEDGQRVPASAMLVEAGDSQPTNLVMAVDVSTEPADLAQIQTGLLSLIDRMQPGDQAMLISFFDEVRLVQPLTADLDQLRTAVRQLSAGGNYTSLNRATIEAFTQAQSLPADQRAVLIVTDSVENLTDSALNVSGDSAIPAYVVAYSPKVQAPGVMDTFARQIGAELTLVDSATAAQVRLQTLAFGSAARSYRLRFTSALPADNADHTLSINLSDGTAADRDNQLFRARGGTVTVETPSLVNGAQIGGLLAVTPQITAPAPVQQVEYLLDGQSVAVVSTPPFAYTFDTAGMTPGSHVVGVRVLDSVGNRAEQLVTVTVVDPLQVSVRTQPERYFLGDSVTVLADVNALNGIASVDFLLNDIVVAEVVNPPYQFTLDTAGYSTGSLPLTVRVRDASGYAESSDVPLTLTTRPPRYLFSGQVWLRIFAVLAMIGAVLLTWLLLSYFAVLARRQRRARFEVEVRNEGNGVSAYLLRADDPKGRLEFSFLLKGLRLQGRNLIEWEPIRQPAAPVAAPTRNAAPLAMPAQSMTMQPTAAVQAAPATAMRGAAQAQKSASERFGQTASWLTSATRAFAGLFEALARFVPASMGGDALQRAAAGAQSARSKSMSAYRLNQEVEGAREAVHEGRQAIPGSVQPAAVKAATAQVQAQPVTAVVLPPTPAQLPPPVTMPSAQTIGPLPSADTAGRGLNGHHKGALDTDLRTDANGLRTDANGTVYRKVVRHDPDAAWTETPEIAPGDVLSLELLIEPKRVGRTRVHPFQIRSIPVAESAGTPLLTEGSAKIRGVSWLLWFLLPTLVILAATAVVLFMLGFLLSEFGMLPVLPSLPWLPFNLA